MLGPMRRQAFEERSGLPASRATIVTMAGFNRPGSQPPRRRGLFGNRSDTRPPVRRVASSAPTRAAVSYTTSQPRRGSDGGGGGSFLRSVSRSLTRLVGVGAVIILLLAALFALRGLLSLGDMGATESPGEVVPSAAPGAPLLITPDPSTVAAQTVTIRGSLPDDLLGLSDALLRIKIVTDDGSVITGAEVELPKTPGFEIPGIPLASGENVISAVVVVDGAEKTPSNTVTVTRDTTSPEVTITSPNPGQLVSGADVTVRGESEGDANIQVRNETSGISSSGVANSNGQYSINISLRNGINVISVTATDGVGNSSRTSVEITTSASVGRVTLVVNPGTIFLNKSPKSFRITATATDSTGAPVVGAGVCIMITAPGLSPITLPCSTSDSNGRAIGEYTFPENYVTEGRGLILATYTLSQGDPLEATTGFSVMKKP